MLEDMGATLVYFSPLTDAHVSEVDALIFGGGYPELYAKQLYENQSMRASVWQALKQACRAMQNVAVSYILANHLPMQRKCI